MGAHEPKGETPGAAPAYLTTPPLGTVSGLSPAGQQRAGQWAGQLGWAAGRGDRASLCLQTPGAAAALPARAPFLVLL